MGITCPLVEIGLSDLPKSGCALDKATISLSKTVDSEIISNLLQVGRGRGRIWAALELIQAVIAWKIEISKIVNSEIISNPIYVGSGRGRIYSSRNSKEIKKRAIH